MTEKQASKYNLFVADETIMDSGTFTLPIVTLMKNVAHPVALNDEFMKEALQSPSVICKKNSGFSKTYSHCFAHIGMVYDYEVAGHLVKFFYKSYLLFPQQDINEKPDLFGIAHSEQRNELDYMHWEIKDIYLLKALNIENNFNAEEVAK